MNFWRVQIQVWPFHGESEKTAGDKVYERLVKARDFAEAARLAHMLQDALRHNPAVWKAPIFRVEIYQGEVPTDETRAAL